VRKRAAHLLITLPQPTRTAPRFSGTTLKRPCRTSGESAKQLVRFNPASVFGFAIGFPALIFTCGTRGSLASTRHHRGRSTALFLVAGVVDD